MDMGGAQAPVDGNFNKSMEFMMMKRLNFLRSSLDSHNPHETTLHMRDNAAKRRDERIMELWRKDQMAPTVQELVSKMKMEKGRQTRNDWSDDNENDMESLIGDPGMESVASDKMGPPSNNKQMQQNSLFSSIQGGYNNTSISISGENSVGLPFTDSRIKQHSKGTNGVDEDGTIGGSTQYPYPHESI